jgi:ABC-type dipeptide/oligopeptide/nickel transport system permease component
MIVTLIFAATASVSMSQTLSWLDIMSLPTVSKETMEEMMAKIGLNEDKLKEAVKVLKEWLKQQPHLPSEFGKEISSNSYL